MANRAANIGVPQDAAADIVAHPTVTDIGVPASSTLIAHDNDPQSATRKLTNTHPAVRLIATRGISVPYNPVTGTTSS